MGAAVARRAVALGRSEVKGLCFHNLIASLERLRGPDVLARFRAHLPAQLARQLESGGLVMMGWYPLEVYETLHAAAQAATGEGPQLAYELGYDATLQDFNGIYRLLRFVLEPEVVFKRAPHIFSRYRRPAMMFVEVASHGYIRARFEGCAGYDVSNYKEIEGGTVAILETCGARDVRAQLAEIEPGVALGEARWTT